MKKSPLNSDAKWANRDPGTNMTQKRKLENPSSYKKKLKLGEKIIDRVTNYLDWDGDKKVKPWELGLEAATTFAPAGLAAKGLSKGYKFLKAALKRESSSPFNHCDSEMMHSGGWGKVRKYNSPGTTGNKEGIKHNEKMRENIGTFKMPHATPLAATENDSIAASNAWKREKELYLKKPDGQKEYDMEKGEKYYDVVKKKLRLIPTNDAEEKDLTGIKKWQLAPNRKSSMSPLNIDPFAMKKPVRKKDEKLKTSVLYGTTMNERKSHYEADKPRSNYFMRKKELKELKMSPLKKKVKKMRVIIK